MGKLIVFEGTDGTGKSTQFALLTKRLQDEGTDFRKLQFPQYLEPSSALIRMYLNGEFGENPDDVNAYAASTFYAVDRYASYVRVWRDYYAAGGLVLSDRYTTSNAVHQGGKVPPEGGRTFSPGSTILNTTRWGCRSPISFCASTCRSRWPSSSCAGAKRTRAPRPTFTSATRPI
jgi:hypothetical protein